MERRVLLAIFLAFLVLYTWQALFVKPVPKPTAAGQAPNAPAAAMSASPPPGASPASVAPAEATAQSAEAPPPSAGALVTEAAERDVRVETRDVIAVFTNRGGRLKSWRLKRYLNQAREPQELVENGAATQPLPFTLRTGTDTIDSTLNT